MQRAIFFLGAMRVELAQDADAHPLPAATEMTVAGIERFIAQNASASHTVSILLPADAGKEEGRAAAEAACRFLLRRSPVRCIRFLVQHNFDDALDGAASFLAALTAKTFRNPVPTVDIIIRYRGGIVLVKRKNPPDGWAIPGGFVDYGESLEDAAAREAFEETGLSLSNLSQFHTYSRPDRDPRHHTITTVFAADGTGRLTPADDAEEAGVFARGALPAPLAFDHATILDDYFSGRY